MECRRAQSPEPAEQETRKVSQKEESQRENVMILELHELKRDMTWKEYFPESGAKTAYTGKVTVDELLNK